MRAVFIALVVGCALVQPLPAAQTATFTEAVIWSFGSGTDGQNPVAALIDETGTLYGTTELGGIHGGGTVFALDPSTGAEAVLYSFCRKVQHYNCLDGAWPLAGLIDVRGKLYGTTEGGGETCGTCAGTVFSLDPGTRREKVRYTFCGDQGYCADGQYPTASLIDVNGVLYGTTDEGGGSNLGTAFSLDPKTGIGKQLYSFCSQQNCTDGSNSNSALIDVNGTLYGTTLAGGADYTGCGNSGCGTVYALDPATGTETVLYSFVGGKDGQTPEGSLIDVNGKLYGVTQGGGAHSYGTIFSIDRVTGSHRVLYSFCGQQGGCTDDGVGPLDGLIDVNGTLYGTTIYGGAYGRGTVFSFDPVTGAETVLYSFCSQSNCTDGASPWASLIDVNGVLYGTTQYGGAYGNGTVFALANTR